MSFVYFMLYWSCKSFIYVQYGGLKHDINKDIFTYNFRRNNNSYDFDVTGVFIQKKKNPDDKRNTILRLIVLSFAAVSIFVLLLGSGLIIMYFEDLRRWIQDSYVLRLFWGEVCIIWYRGSIGIIMSILSVQRKVWITWYL